MNRSSAMSAINFLLGRFLENLSFDFEWLTGRFPLNYAQRLVYLLNKYAAILGNKREIEFLGRRFSYDNRLAPALLQTYPKEIDELSKCIDFRKMHSVFDVGANVGQFGWTLKAFFPHLNIFSFEPNPVVLPLLQSNAAKVAGWHVYGFGVGSQLGKIPLFFVPGKSAQGSAFQSNSSHNLQSQNTEMVEIEIRQLDDATLLQERLPTKVDLLKIDVEGYELEALRGLASLQWTYLFIEISEVRAGGVTSKAVVSLIEQLWKKTPQLIWADEKSSATKNVLFQMPE